MHDQKQSAADGAATAAAVAAPAPADTSAVEARRALIADCLVELGLGLDEACAPLPDVLTFGGQTLAVDPWVRGHLEGTEPSAPAGLRAHLVEAIALCAKGRTELERLQTNPPGPSELDDFRAELIRTATVGVALQRELQTDTDELVAGGSVQDAKKLTAFRRELDRVVADLKKSIGPESFALAESRAGDFVLLREPAKKTRVRLEEPSPESPQPFKRTRPRPVAQPAQVPARAIKLRFGLCGFGFLLLVYVVFFFPNRGVADLPPRLTAGDFAHVEGVVSTRARPPSVYVSIEAAAWRDLTPDGRERVVAELGRVAGEHGYFGLQLKTTAGETVGQWLSKSGPRVVDADP